MVKYDRVSTINNDHHSHDETTEEGLSGTNTTTTNDPMDYESQIMTGKSVPGLYALGSTSSAASSYASLQSVEKDGVGNSSIHRHRGGGKVKDEDDDHSRCSNRSSRSNNNNKAIYKQQQQQVQDDVDDDDDDHDTHRSGERSPLRKSFDSDDQAFSVSSSLHGGVPALAGTKTRSRDDGDDDPNNTNRHHPSISSNWYSPAFDFDDDDDDEELEAELRRYHLNFSSTTTARGNTTVLTHSGNNSPTAASSRFSLAKYVWYSFQSVRQQARQRRAQLLLQQTERNWQQSLWICMMTNCDATDRGILLVATLIVVWALLVWRIHDPTIRRWIVLGGIVAFVVRVGTRPLFGYCRKQQQKRRLLRTMQQLPQHSPISKRSINNNGQGAARRSTREGIQGPTASLSLPSDLGQNIGMPPYAGQPQQSLDQQQLYHSYGNNNTNGSLELSSVRSSNGNGNGNGSVWVKDVVTSDDDAMLDIQPSQSTGSDPTVAAI